MGSDNVVGIATRYGLDGPGIESRWKRDLPQPSGPALGPTQPPVWWVPTHSGGRGVKYPSPSSTVVKERVELYTCVYMYIHIHTHTPHWIFVACSSVNFTLF